MKKLNALQVMAVWRDVPDTLRKLASERDTLKAENQRLRMEKVARDKADRIAKLASDIHEKGLAKGRSVEDTVSFLREKDKLGKLEVVAAAVEMNGAQLALGSLDESTPSSGGKPEAAFVSSLLALS